MVKPMKKTLFKYFGVMLCCFGLSGCISGFLFAVVSNGCPTCPEPQVKSYTAKDGSVFYNKNEMNWYENLSQRDKDLYHKNMKICSDYIKSDDYKKEYERRKKEAGNNGGIISAIGYSIEVECLKKLNTPDYYKRW